MSSQEPTALDHELIVLFDGHCVLCERSVHFIVRHDARGTFKFAAAQSKVGEQLQARYAVDALELDSLVLIDHGAVRTRSAAAIGIAKRLDGAWSCLAVAWIVPRPIRDWAYTRIARRRYRWFGEKPSCMSPTPELASRFLSD